MSSHAAAVRSKREIEIKTKKTLKLNVAQKTEIL